MGFLHASRGTLLHINLFITIRMITIFTTLHATSPYLYSTLLYLLLLSNSQHNYPRTYKLCSTDVDIGHKCVRHSIWDDGTHAIILNDRAYGHSGILHRLNSCLCCAFMFEMNYLCFMHVARAT